MRTIIPFLSLLILLSPVSCTDKNASKPELLSKWLTASIESVESTYGKDPEAYERAIVNLIYGLRSVPIVFLGPLEKMLTERIEDHGVEPYYSIVLEYISRYAKVPQDSTRERFEKFREFVMMKVKSRAPYDSTAIVILESRRGRFKFYSQSVAPMLVSFATTKLGQNLYYRGATNEALLRIVYAGFLCKQRNDSSSYLSKSEKANCTKYLDAINEAYKQFPKNFNDLSNPAQIQRGIMSGFVECLQSLNSNQQLVQRFEDFLHCKETASQATTNDITPSGSLMTPTSTPPHQTGGYLADLLNGASYDGSDDTEEVFNPDGIGQQTDHHYTGADGRKITISNYEYTDSNGQHSGTTVQQEDTEGTSIDAYSSTGQHLGTHWEGTGANANNSYSADYNDNGTLSKEVIQQSNDAENGGNPTTTVVEYDGDGNVKSTTKYDTESRTCISGCDPPASTSMPADEVMGDPCFQEAFGINSDDDFSSAGSLDPWINPNPEGGFTPESDITACLPSGSSAICPPSLMYCVDETTSQCGCGSRSTGTVPNRNSNCQKINCGDGTCDQATGMCGNGRGELFPPERGPLPVGDLPYKPFLGLPVEFRSRSKSDLWQPDKDVSWLSGKNP